MTRFISAEELMKTYGGFGRCTRYCCNHADAIARRFSSMDLSSGPFLRNGSSIDLLWGHPGDRNSQLLRPSGVVGDEFGDFHSYVSRDFLG